MSALNPANASVLIVEDSPDDAEIASKALEKFGIRECHWEQTAEDALLFLAKKSCDVVLVDYNLPGMNGLRLLERIRQEWPDTQVIIVTSARSEEVAVATMKAGAADYVAKDDLLTAGIFNSLQSALRGRVAAREDQRHTALGSGTSKVETALQEIAWVSESFSAGMLAGTGEELDVPDVLADDSMIRRPTAVAPFQDMVDAMDAYLRAACDRFPEPATDKEQALARMILERGLNTGDVFRLFITSLRRFESHGRQPPFSPALCLTRIFALQVEQLQASAVFNSVRRAA